MSQSQNHYSSSSSSSSNAHAELAHPHTGTGTGTGTSTPPTASTADLTTLGTKIVYQPITLAQALQNYNNDARLALEDIIASRNSINYDAAKLSNDNARLWGLVEKFRRENEALRARINSGSPAGSLPANTTTTATRGSPLTAAPAPATAPPHRSHFDLTSLSASGSPVSSHNDTGITPKSRQYASADAASLAIAASHASLAQAVGMPNNNKTLSEQEAAAAAAARAQNIMQQRMAAQAQAQALGGGAIPGLAASSAGPSSSSNSSQQHHSSGAGGSGPNQNTAQNFSSSGHSRNPAGTGLARGGESLYGRLSSESEGESFAAVDDSDAEHGPAQEAHPDAPKSGQTATGGSLGSIHSALGLSHDTVSQQQTPQQQPKMLHQHHQQQQQQQQQQQAGNSRNMAGVGAGGNTSSPRRAPQQLPLSPRSRATGLPPDQHQHQYHQQQDYDSPTSPPSNPYSAQAKASALLQAAAGVSSTSAGSPGGSSAASGGRHGRQRTQDIGQAIAQAAFLSSSSTAPRLDAATLTNSTAIHVPSSRLRVLERGRETVYFEISITILVPPAHWGPPPPSNAQGLLMGEYPPMKWTVEKTVSDLGGLDGRLRQKHGKSATKKLPELPDQSLFGDHAPSRVDQRKTVVETYLQKLLNLSLPDKDDICTFLCTDVARPRPVDPAALQKEGFLTKKGLNPGRWVTRYYCLRNPASGTQPNGTSSTSAAGSDNKQPFRLDYYEYLGGPQIGSINIVGAEIGRQQRNTASDMDENSYRHAFLILERRPVTGPTNGELASSGTMNSLSSGYSGSTGATLTPGAGAAGSAAGTGTGTGNGTGTGSASTSTMQTVRHVLCAENDRERDEWVDLLVRAIDTAHRETTQSGSSSTSAAPSQSGHPSQQQQQHLQAAPVLGNNNNNSQASHPGSPQLNNAMGLASMDQGVHQQLPGSTSFAELSSPVSSSAATGSPAHHAWNPPSGAGSSATGSGSVSGPSGVGAGQRHGKNVPSSSSAGGQGQGQYASGAGSTYSPRGANTSLPSESGHGTGAGAGAGAVHGYAQNHGYGGGGGGGGYGQASLQQTHGGYEVSAARMAGPGRSMSTDAGGSSEGGRVMSGTTASGSVGNLGHHETSSVSLVSSAATAAAAAAAAAAAGNSTSVSTPFRTNKAAISGPMNGTPIPQGYKFGGSSAASAARGVNAGSGSGGGGGGSGSGNTAGGSGAGGGGPDDEVGERKEKESEKKRFWQGFRGFGNSDKDKNGNHSFGRGQQQQQQQDAARPVFGVSLVDAIAVSSVSEGLGLPSVVYRCIEYLERKQAFKEEGIYRLSGSSAVIKSLKDRFNTVGDVDLLAPGVEYYDPHAVAGLLKTFLRELPESVLTRELHFEFLRVNDVPDRRDRVRELGRLVCMLPLANYSVLRTLCSHLIKIIQHADVNKMTMRNVGIVFSPTLAIPAGVFALLLTEFDYVFFTDATGLRAPMTIEDEEAHEAAVAAAAAAAEAAIQRQLSPPPGAAPNPSSPGGQQQQQQQTGGLMAPGPRKAGRNPNRGSWIAGTTLHSGGDGATHQLAMQMAAAQEASSMPSPSQVQAAIAAAGSSSSSSGPGSAASGIGNGGTSLSASPSGQRSNRNSLSYNESDAERLLGLGGGMNGHNLVGQGLSALEISKAEEELGAMSSALMSAGSASSGSGGGDGGGRGHGHGHGHGHGQGHGQGNVMMMGGGMVAPPAGSGGESAEY